MLKKKHIVLIPGGGGRGDAPPPPCRQKKKKKEKKKKKKKKKKKIGPGIRQVTPPQHDVWGGLECTAAPVSVHKDTHLDFEEVVTAYGHKHPRRMLLGRPGWMHDFFHVEHLFFDFPYLPSDLKYFVKIVNICTNYLANSLSDFSEIIPQNSEKCISAHPNFQDFPGGACPRPP